jgi:hypothetical protein
MTIGGINLQLFATLFATSSYVLQKNPKEKIQTFKPHL